MCPSLGRGLDVKKYHILTLLPSLIKIYLILSLSFTHTLSLLQVTRKRAAHATTSYAFLDDSEEMILLGCDGCPEEDEVDVRELQDVWAGFHKLMEAIRSVPGTENSMSAAQFQAAAIEWAVHFWWVTYDEDVIPYIHCKL